MAKRYSNVKDMIKDVSEDKKFKDKAVKEIEKKQISKLLVIMRCDNKLTQKDMAERMGCTQGKISKIESSYDDSLSIKDLKDYAESLNLQLEIGYRQHSVKLVDLIKYHALKINQYLDQLVSITKGKKDDQIEEGVKSFFSETIVNMNKIIFNNLSKLEGAKRKQVRETSSIHISYPIENKKKTAVEEKKERSGGKYSA